MITLERPIFLLLLPALVLIYFIIKLFLKKCAYKFSIKNWQSTEKEKLNLSYTLYKVFFNLNLVLVAFSLTEPCITKNVETFTTNSASVMFVLDISPSMSIVDIDFEEKTISRLEASKQIIQSFISKNKNICVGLTAFGTDSCLVVPETTNEEIFLTRLETLTVGELGDKTAQGTALATALLHTENKKNSYIVLLTDGENNSSSISPLSVAEIIKKRETVFYILGLGKPGEGKIEYLDIKTQQKIYGTSFKSFDEAALKQLATVGNATFTQATSFQDLSIPISSISYELENNFIKTSKVEKNSLQKNIILLSLLFILLSLVIKHIARVVF